jgi:hypothetical protein
MNGETGEMMRDAFEEHFEQFGEDFHVDGETKRAVFSDHKGVMKITFLPGEFSLRNGAIIKRWATETDYVVVSTKQNAVAGVVISFEAIVRPR